MENIYTNTPITLNVYDVSTFDPNVSKDEKNIKQRVVWINTDSNSVKKKWEHRLRAKRKVVKGHALSVPSFEPAAKHCGASWDGFEDFS